MEQNRQENNIQLDEIKIKIEEKKTDCCKICGLKNSFMICNLCKSYQNKFSMKRLIRSSLGGLIPVVILPAFNFIAPEIICLSFGFVAVLEFIV